MNKHSWTAVILFTGVFFASFFAGGHAALFVNGIALAIVTAGRWNPFGCLAAALIFGFADALQYQGQALGINVPKDLLLALPYLATLLILAFGAKRVTGPESLGRPYLKG